MANYYVTKDKESGDWKAKREGADRTAGYYNTQAEAAAEKVMSFAKEHGLQITPARGKVIEYLKRAKPHHYQALITAGAVKDI